MSNELDFKSFGVSINKSDYDPTKFEEVRQLYNTYYSSILFDKSITALLIFGIVVFFSLYLYYSLENLRLINNPSLSCPIFYCPSNNKDNICNGRAYYLDPDGNKRCTDINY